MRPIQVVKIGTNSVFNNNSTDYALLSGLGYDLAKFGIEKNTDSVLVISGAVRLGMRDEGLTQKPKETLALQSCARAGQPLLEEVYRNGLELGHRKYCNENGINPKFATTQFLVTYHNLDDRLELENIVSGVKYDLSKGKLPKFNYNDGVDPTEVERDNDNLAARIAKALEEHGSKVKRLVIMTDDGLKDKEGKLVTYVGEINEYIRGLVWKGGSGNGGMNTKLDAAKMLLDEGIPTIIGDKSYGLQRLVYDAQIRTIIRRLALKRRG